MSQQELPFPKASAAPRRVGRLSQARAEELTAYLFIAPWAIGFILFTLGAMVFSLGLSTVDTDLLSSFQFTGLKNYSDLVHDALFFKALSVTLFYTVLVVPCG